VGAIILACSDGRLREQLLALETRLGIEGADRVQVPGGPLALLRTEHQRRSLTDWLGLLIPAHAIERICLVSHEDCLGYAPLRAAGHDERRALERDAHAARDQLRQRLPHVVVEGYIVPFDSTAHRFGSPERVA
jgi:hypothetical protein